MMPIKLYSFFLFVSFATSAVAQPFRGEGPRAAERIEQLKKVRMIEELDLSEEQSIRFFARLNEHEKKQRELSEEKNETLDDLAKLVGNSTDGDEYEEFFSGIQSIDDRMREQERLFFKGLREILSEEQRAQFVLFGRRFQEELRDAIRTLRRSPRP